MQLVLREISGSLPTSIFDFMDGDKHIGMLQVRHRPSASPGLPDNFVSHIYYQIDEAQRKKGCGKEILKLGLEEAKKIGLNSVVTICDEDNVGSKKIIESNGGKFEDSCINHLGNRVLKYSFNLE